MSGVGDRARRRLPPRMLRRLILSALLGAAFGVVSWYLGMDAAHAVGLGASAFAFTACLSALGEAADVAWSVPPPAPRAGARRDIVQLGWSLGARGGRSSPEAVRRLRNLAERGLRLRGIELEDRASDDLLRELLGEEALRLLRRGSGVAPPRTAQVTAALGRLEALLTDDVVSGVRSDQDPAAAGTGDTPPRSRRTGGGRSAPRLTPIPAATAASRRRASRRPAWQNPATPPIPSTPPTEEQPHVR